MVMTKRQLLLAISLFFVLSGCGKFEASKNESKTMTSIETEERKDKTMANEETIRLGEKQGEGNLLRENFTDYHQYEEELVRLSLIPAGYELQEVQTGISQNNEEVVRLRYGLIGQEIRLSGEHCSAVFRVADEQLLGFMAIRQAAVIEDVEELPTAEVTTEITETFLEKVAPGYFAKLNNLWIDRHDEPLVSDGKERLVTGTKYKCFVPEEGSYAWVVVDKNQDVMIFERGIQWVNSRTTEKWLYDDYLKDGRLDLFAVRQN